MADRPDEIFAAIGLTPVATDNDGTIEWRPGDAVATPSQPSKPASGTRWVYEQECDQRTHPQRVAISIDTLGAGGYVVLRTARWAMDGPADVAQLVRWILDAIERAREVE